MKKYLFLFISIFLLMPGVKAEEYNTCYDEFKIADSLSFTLTSNYHSNMKVKLPIEPEKTYYLKLFNLDFSKKYQIGSMHKLYDANDKLLETGQTHLNVSKISDTGVITYSLRSNLENLSYFYLAFYVFENNGFYTPNSDVILTLSDHELTSCPEILPPEPPVYDGDQVQLLNNFYSIYLDKLTYLADYAINNYLFLVFICIILLFGLLELFLYLYNLKGGRRR